MKSTNFAYFISIAPKSIKWLRNSDIQMITVAKTQNVVREEHTEHSHGASHWSCGYAWQSGQPMAAENDETIGVSLTRRR